MRIRLRKPYRQWQRGDVVDLPSGIASTLIEYGKAEVAVDTKRVAAPPRNKAVAGAGSTKYGAGIDAESGG